MMKSGRRRWTRHAAYMGIRRMHIRFRWESHKEGDHQEDLDVDETKILK
jgi:hypothetical protein